MEARIAVTGPLDVTRTLERFRLWGEDPAARLGEGVLRRAIRVDGRPRGYELRWSGPVHAPRVWVHVPGRVSDTLALAAAAEARRLCGLGFDLGAFYRAARRDRVLARLVGALRGLRPTLVPRPFEMLVGAVCAQQVNLRWAATTRGRLVSRYGEAVEVGGERVYAFPEARALAGASVGELRAMQFTTGKAEYIVGLARLVASGELDLCGMTTRSNDEVIGTLTRVRGLGRWSAEWFLARGLGRGDVCPAGDLAVRRAFSHFYGRGRVLSEVAIRRRAAVWGEQQNLVVHYLLAGERLTSRPGAGGA